MMRNQEINCLFVLGAYRSGASVMAGCLKILGAQMGHNLISPAGEDEPEIFEHQDIRLTHDILLRDLGCSWDMIGSLPNDWKDSQAAQEARKRINGIIDKNFASAKIWAVKDPKLCRLMPLWIPLLKERGLIPGYIMTIRHPWESALSLSKINGFDLLKGHLLWLTLNREVLNFMRTQCLRQNQETPPNEQLQSHALITYDRLLADPITVVHEIQKKMPLLFPDEITSKNSEILNFVRSELKHFHINSKVGNNQEKADFSHFDSIYNQFRAGQAFQAKSLPGSSQANKDFYEKDPESFFPVHPLPQTETREPAQILNYGSKSRLGSRIFSDFLSLISGYEQSQHKLRLERNRRILASNSTGKVLLAQILLPDADGKFYPEHSDKIFLPPDEWYELKISITDSKSVNKYGLRLDPLNIQGTIAVSGIEVINSATREKLLMADPKEADNFLRPLKNIIRLPLKDSLSFLATSHQPQLELTFADILPDSPLQLCIWIKVSTELGIIKQVVINSEKVKKQLSKANSSLNEMKELKNQKEQENQELNRKIKNLENKLKLAQDKYEDVNKSIELKTQQINELNSKSKNDEIQIQNLKNQNERENQELNQKINNLENKLKLAQDKYEDVNKSIELKTQQINELNSKSKNDEIQIQNLKNQNEQENQELNRKINNLENKLTQQEKLTREYFQELSNAEEQLTEKIDIENQLNSSKQRIYYLESNLRQKENQLHTLNQQKDILLKKMEKMGKKYESKANIFTKIAIKRKKQELYATIKKSGFFDPDYYLEIYPDVKDQGMDPLKHYMNHGWKEGRNPSPRFNTQEYLEQNPDVAMELMNPLEHYVLYGQNEDRPK